MDQKNNIPLFFIIGRPRSGTTLLRLLFESHPNVIIPPESPVILGLYKRYSKLKNWEEKDILNLINNLYKQRYFDLWLFNREQLTAKLLEYTGKNSFDSIIRTLYLLYQSPFPKEKILLIGDKNPGYSMYIRELQKLYPESKFIFINRDYRDNYLSLTNVNFEVPVVPLVVYRWKFAYKQFLKLQKKSPDRFYYLKYEDLATDPQKEFHQLCEYLDIKYDPAVFDFHEKKGELEKMYAHDPLLQKIHQSLLNPIDQSRIGKWEAGMTDNQVKAADHVAGKYAEKAGYKRKFPKSNLWLSIKFAPLLFYANTIYQMMLASDKLPYRLRNVLLETLGIFVKFYWSLNPGKVKR